MSHSVEFIGAKIRVISSANKCLEGLEGSIIDETKNTLRIRDRCDEEKTLLKQGAVFLINNQKSF